jgi:hypothetical protein
MRSLTQVECAMCGSALSLKLSHGAGRSARRRHPMHPFVAPAFGPQTILVSFGLLFFGGLLFYVLTSGSSYLYYCILRV